jgi:dipeptidase
MLVNIGQNKISVLMRLQNELPRHLSGICWIAVEIEEKLPAIIVHRRKLI